ncbi:unnamed protein product, partial [Hapterophycus canaliculatus]
AAAAPSPFGTPAAPAPGGVGASPFAAAPAGRGDPAVLRAWMQEVYAKFKPENVPKIDRFLVKYKNNEWKMIEGILKKYGHLGVGPPAGWSPPPPAAAGSPTAPMGFGQVCTTSFGQASGLAGASGFGQQQQQQPFGQAASTGFG